MTGSSNESGFTLIELLVVLVIIAAAVALSLPYSRESGKAHKLAAAAQSLAAKLEEASALAISSNREQRITIDLQQHLVTLARSSRQLKLPQEIGLEITTASNEIAKESASFRFFPDGGASGGKIRLADGDRQQEIAINWLTGAIVLTKGEKP